MSDSSRPNQHRPLSRRSVLGALALGCFGLAGCQVGPLYGDRASLDQTSAVANALGNIAIDPPSDRITQLVRNELVFGLNSQASTATFRMSLRASSSNRSLGVTSSGASFAQSVQVTASYRLFRTGETQPLLENTVFSTASFDTSGQRFSNQRAVIDAQERAAREAAATIEAQIAAAFARGL